MNPLPRERSIEEQIKRSLPLLCFTTASGLLAFVAAMFTTMLEFSDGWRYSWLGICLVALVLSLIGVVLFCRSYKRDTGKPKN
jgi:drug/metabolite transporter (DMT)-like permease